MKIITYLCSYRNSKSLITAALLMNPDKRGVAIRVREELLARPPVAMVKSTIGLHIRAAEENRRGTSD
jgi:hypothetical protein